MPRSPAKKKSSFVGRLSKPHFTFTLSGWGSLDFSTTLDGMLKNNRFVEFGFVTKGPASFSRVFSSVCAFVIGKTPDEISRWSVPELVSACSFSPDERAYVEYSLSLIQDASSRVPSDDPLSRALGKISRLHDEFPMGDRTADEED